MIPEKTSIITTMMVNWQFLMASSGNLKADSFYLGMGVLLFWCNITIIHFFALMLQLFLTSFAIYVVQDFMPVSVMAGYLSGTPIKG